VAIQSFGDSKTEKIFLGLRDKEVAKVPPSVLRIAERKLDMLEAAFVLQERVPQEIDLTR
jgi:proteic killer suppression protein